MSRLFAAHLLQPATSLPLSGHYDQEQELWVGDNQLLGVKYPTQTQPNTWDTWVGTTYAWTGCNYSDIYEDITRDPDPDDTDEGA